MEKGYDPSTDMNNLSIENQQLQQKNLQLSSALTGAGISEQEDNLIQYQLETDKILERCEHYLKGDQIKFDKNGAYFTDPTKNVLAIMKTDSKTKIIYYIQEVKEAKKGTEVIKEVLVKITNKDGNEINVMEQDSKRMMEKLNNLKLTVGGYKYIEVLDEDKRPLNEYGVAEFMRILGMYVTKETFLSYYSQERIYEIMGDFSDALNNFLYCNYEKMGMDTKFKESKYTMICLNIMHVVESCYNRALDGAEQENLRTRSIVTQSNMGGGSMGRPMPHAKKKWHPFKPSSW